MCVFVDEWISAKIRACTAGMCSSACRCADQCKHLCTSDDECFLKALLSKNTWVEHFRCEFRRNCSCAVVFNPDDCPNTKQKCQNIGKLATSSPFPVCLALDPTLLCFGQIFANLWISSWFLGRVVHTCLLQRLGKTTSLPPFSVFAESRG